MIKLTVAFCTSIPRLCIVPTRDHLIAYHVDSTHILVHLHPHQMYRSAGEPAVAVFVLQRVSDILDSALMAPFVDLCMIIIPDQTRNQLHVAVSDGFICFIFLFIPEIRQFLLPCGSLLCAPA